MRTLLLTTALFFSACGGNWSNGDLVFANALPRSTDLKSTLPANASTTSPLEGVATRRDELMVGDASNTWKLTRQATHDYNGVVDMLLGIVDQVRLVAPTSRSTNSRTWGPFSDTNNPGRELRVVISQTTDERSFTWSVESRPNNGEWLQVITGNFIANGDTSVRSGQGAIQVPVKAFRDVIKTDANIAQLDSITIGYVTDSWPHRVEMNFVAKPDATLSISGLGYTSLLQQDGSGSMRFLFSSTDVNISQLEITAAWKSTGEGRGLGTVRAGNYTGAQVTECWGSSFTVSYYSESWSGGMTSGREADCVTFAP